MTAMHAGQTVGILMDTNMTPPQGAFVEFFGLKACTATGLAHVARKTGAAVLRVHAVEPSERKYVLHLAQRSIPHTADAQADILAGTRHTPRSKRGFGAILTSGYGFTGGGRQGRRSEPGLY